MDCRVCGSPIAEFISLGEMPLVNHFLTKAEIDHEEKFDLSVGFCPTCYLVQLMNTVDPGKLFRNYVYFSSTSTSFLDHCKKTADYLTTRLGLSSNSLVLEVASNDGAQLQYFKDLGIPVLGIDPAENIADVANARGIKTIPEFFNYRMARRLRETDGVQADLIFGANVLAHVPAIVDFVRGIKTVLVSRGTAVFEFPYLRGLMENKFDTIYHEHVFYYSLLALSNLFHQADLEVYDVEITSVQGGSLRIFVSHPGDFEIGQSVRDLLDQERQSGFDRIVTYQRLEQNIRQLKTDLIDLLQKIKSEGKTVAAYSAPAKGNILLNYFGINSNYLDFIVDKSEAKQGLYTPGTHLLVEPVDKIYRARPDYLLILCWNIADEVIDQLTDYHQAGGRFIVPIPQLKIV